MKRKLSEFSWTSTPALFLFVGIFLRIVQYLGNRSLWLDELMLSRNILDKSFLEFLQPLNYNQGAPFLFLCLQKLMTELFGPSEYVLRFLPLVASVISLLLFYHITKLLFEEVWCRALLMFLFAFSYPLVYQAQEVKQYSVDVVVTLGLLYMFIRMVSFSHGKQFSLLMLGILGAVFIWLSHPTVFVLAGIGLAIMLSIYNDRKQWRLPYVFLAFSLWGASFISNYLLILIHLQGNDSLANFWKNGFFPLPYRIANVITAKDIVSNFFDYAFWNEHLTILVITTFVVIATVSTIRRKSIPELSVLLCIVMTIVASALNKYPFSDRLILFLVPCLYLLTVLGIRHLAKISNKPLTVVAVIIVLMPSLYSGMKLSTWIEREESRPLLKIVAEESQNGDGVYIYDSSKHAAKYYSKLWDINDNKWQYLLSTDQISSVKEKNSVPFNDYSRVWLFFAHNKKNVPMVCSTIHGKIIKKIKQPGALLFLYEIKRKQSPFSLSEKRKLSLHHMGKTQIN